MHRGRLIEENLRATPLAGAYRRNKSWRITPRVKGLEQVAGNPRKCRPAAMIWARPERIGGR